MSADPTPAPADLDASHYTRSFPIRMWSVSMNSAGWRKSEPLEADGPGAADARGRYRDVSPRRADAEAPFLDGLIAAMTDLGYPAHDCAGIRLALEEAVVYGLGHGNWGDPAKRVRILCRLSPEALLAEVEDEGPGLDPTRPENLGRPGGRGLLSMRHDITWVGFSRRCNRVTLRKSRSL